MPSIFAADLGGGRRCAAASRARARFFGGLLALAGTLSACAAAPARPAGSWTERLGVGHPLVGRVWSHAQQRLVPRSALHQALAGAPVLLLGEKHDNADHHRLQAELLARWLGDGQGRAVGFEMLDAEQAPALETLAPRSPERLAAAVDWAHSGWPPFELYRPVFRVVLASRARVLAAHPPRAVVRAGLDALPRARREALGLTRPLPAPLEESLREEIRAGHCGHGAPALVSYMVGAQRLKDAWMADALRHAQAPRGVALIAGWGHVRADRGVPFYLHAAGKRALSVAFLEVERERLEPLDYAPLAEGARVFDFVVFTPRVDDVDACTKFRRQLERIRAHKSQRSQ